MIFHSSYIRNHFRFVAAGLLLVTFASHCCNAAAARGLAWGADDSWLPNIATKKMISWAHHWQLGQMPNLPSNVEYVPVNWGTAYTNYWAKRVIDFNCTVPQHILAFNEPDVVSQSNMTPSDAVIKYIAELQPYRAQGSLVSSPQMAFNLTWLDSFLTQLRAAGSDVDFIALHWYGSHTGLADLQWYINQAWTKYKLPIWVTELGTTASTNGNNTQVRNFMSQALTYLDSQAYVERVAWTGNYALTQPPDSYINKYTSFFFSDGTLRQIGQLYACGFIGTC